MYPVLTAKYIHVPVCSHVCYVRTYMNVFFVYWLDIYGILLGAKKGNISWLINNEVVQNHMINKLYFILHIEWKSAELIVGVEYKGVDWMCGLVDEEIQVSEWDCMGE